MFITSGEPGRNCICGYKTYSLTEPDTRLL
jgi:hypothetical protein